MEKKVKHGQRKVKVYGYARVSTKGQAIDGNSLEAQSKLLKENGAELILISTPSTRNWNYTRHEVTEDFAAGKGITYIDLNTIDKSELNIDWNTDTKDGGDHLNVSGAQRVTEWFGRYIDKNYDFVDKRQDADYSESDVHSFCISSASISANGWGCFW